MVSLDLLAYFNKGKYGFSIGRSEVWIQLPGISWKNNWASNWTDQIKSVKRDAGSIISSNFNFFKLINVLAKSPELLWRIPYHDLPQRRSAYIRHLLDIRFWLTSLQQHYANLTWKCISQSCGLVWLQPEDLQGPCSSLRQLTNAIKFHCYRVSPPMRCALVNIIGGASKGS